MGDDAFTDLAVGGAADDTDGPQADSGWWGNGAPGVDSAGHAAGVAKASAAPSSADDGRIVIGLDSISEEEGAVPGPAKPQYE